jgi:hypothetical protein
MSTYSMLRNRFGLSMLPLAGLLAVLGLALRGAFGNPSVDASGFAQAAVSANFGTAWLLILLGSVVRLYSLVVLNDVLAQTRAGRLAWWALVLSFAAEALFLSLTGFLAFAAPVAAKLYLQGDVRMLDVVMAGFFSGPVLSVLYPSGLLGTLGSILFGIAIWRSSSLPKWAGVLYALTTPLLAFAPAFSYTLELLGGLLLLVSSAWIAAAAWGQPAAEMYASTGKA